MFVDASAVVAILTYEPEQDALMTKIEAAPGVALSAMVLFESALALARKEGLTPQEARDAVLAFGRETRASWLPLDARVGALALDAFARFGKGRHPAALNLGDCFSYACARALDAPLLYKGYDFALTDVRPA